MTTDMSTTDNSSPDADVNVADDSDVTSTAEDADPGRQAGEEVAYDLGPDDSGGA